MNVRSAVALAEILERYPRTYWLLASLVYAHRAVQVDAPMMALACHAPVAQA